MTVTDATKSLPDHEINWIDPSRVEYTCLIKPETDNHITLLLTVPAVGLFQVTARFSGAQIDRGAVEKAMNSVLSMDVFR